MLQPPDQRQNRRGVLVVALLAIVFFGLVGLIVYVSRRNAARPPATASEAVYVVPLRLRVRTAPSATAPVVTTIERGDIVQLLEVRDAWAHISTGDLTGWSERESLERQSARVRRLEREEAIRRLPAIEGVVEKEVEIHSGAGIYYPVIGRIAPGRKVKVFTRDHDFFAVDLGGEIAYVEVDAIDISASGMQVEVSAAAPPPEATVTDLTTTTEPPKVAVAEEPPPPEPEPERETPSRPSRDEIYAMVPPGGTPPRIVERTQPSYPSRARNAGIEGVVVLRGIVGTDGRIRDVEVLRDLPFGVGDEARRAVQRWRFAPAELNGRPISVYYTVTVNFRLAR